MKEKNEFLWAGFIFFHFHLALALKKNVLHASPVLLHLWDPHDIPVVDDHWGGDYLNDLVVRVVAYVWLIRRFPLPYA